MYIFGASGHGKVVITAFESCGIKISGVFDDNPGIDQCLQYTVKPYNGGEILQDNCAFIAVGDNSVRKKIYDRLGKGVRYGSVVHDKAFVSEYASYGTGTVIMAGALVQAHAKIGNQVIVNTGAVVDHDCELGDFVHIAPNTTLCGGVKVGRGSLVGAGSTVLPGKRIGESCTIGAGATVLRDVLDGEVVYGVVK
ncbi:acetyltransferase [Echinicola sediminis]